MRVPAGEPTVLAVDIASGGVSAAVLTPDLRVHATSEVEWDFHESGDGAATLSGARVLEGVIAAIRAANRPGGVAALALSSMMHTLVVTDSDGSPRTPVFTWKDGRGPDRERALETLGADYTERTGTPVHPSFPAMKLLWLAASSPDVFEGGCRVSSALGWVVFNLTGSRSENVSIAAASGLLEADGGAWDHRTVEALKLGRDSLPELLEPGLPAGGLSGEASRQTGLPQGLPVVAAGGDGFLATLGSGCEDGEHIALTIGTTIAARKFVPAPVAAAGFGLFCYRFAAGRHLVGCAGSNGGNLLEWSARNFGETTGGADPPLLLPFLNGERSPFWDPARKPRWIGFDHTHSMEDVRRSAIEALAFQSGVYLDLLDRLAPAANPRVVLSGNAFQTPGLTELVAATVPYPVLMPSEPGLATLRGAARVGFGAIDIAAAAPPLAAMRRVGPGADPGVGKRMERFIAEYFRPA